MSEAQRRATRAFVDQLVQALDERVDTERKALEIFHDPTRSSAADDPERVHELLRGIQHADDQFEIAVADASDAFRSHLARSAISGDEQDEPVPLEGSYARSVLDAAGEAFVAIDAGGFIIDWNAAAERTFGWSREEAVGRVLADTIIPEDFREAHLRGLQRLLDTGRGSALGRPLELLALRRDGEEFPVELTISTIPGNGVPRFCAFLREPPVAASRAT